jgi:hypothetical protein
MAGEAPLVLDAATGLHRLDREVAEAFHDVQDAVGADEAVTVAGDPPRHRRDSGPDPPTHRRDRWRNLCAFPALCSFSTSSPVKMIPLGAGTVIDAAENSALALPERVEDIGVHSNAPR